MASVPPFFLLLLPPPLSSDPPSTSSTLQGLGAMGKKARDGTISIDDMAGGTFTIRLVLL